MVWLLKTRNIWYDIFIVLFCPWQLHFSFTFITWKISARISFKSHILRLGLGLEQHESEQITCEEKWANIIWANYMLMREHIVFLKERRARQMGSRDVQYCWHSHGKDNAPKMRRCATKNNNIKQPVNTEAITWDWNRQKRKQTEREGEIRTTLFNETFHSRALITISVKHFTHKHTNIKRESRTKRKRWRRRESKSNQCWRTSSWWLRAEISGGDAVLSGIGADIYLM